MLDIRGELAVALHLVDPKYSFFQGKNLHFLRKNLRFNIKTHVNRADACVTLQVGGGLIQISSF